MNFIGHGNKIIKEKIMDPDLARELVKKSKHIPISSRIARECIDLAYGFFSPLEGFMNSETLTCVCEEMRLLDGTLWPIPILLDIEKDAIDKNKIKVGE